MLVQTYTLCNHAPCKKSLYLSPEHGVTTVKMIGKWTQCLHLNPIPLALVHFCTTPPISYDFSWKYLEIELQKFWLLVFIYEKEFYIFLEFFSMIFMLNKLFCHFVCHLLEVWGSYIWFITRGLICPQPTLD